MCRERAIAQQEVVVDGPGDAATGVQEYSRLDRQNVLPMV